MMTQFSLVLFIASSHLQRRVVTEEHPLAGSIEKRMKLFSTLATPNAQGERPARRIDGDEYHLESDGRAWAV